MQMQVLTLVQMRKQQRLAMNKKSKRMNANLMNNDDDDDFDTDIYI